VGSTQASASAPATPQAASGDVLAAWNDLRAAETSRRAAEEKLAALQRQLDQILTEVVVSYGQVEDLARRVAAKTREFQKIDHPKNGANPAEHERLTKEIATTMNDFGDLFAFAREAQKLESDPEKAARFYATVLGELAGLDETAREPVVRVARERFAEMKRVGLTAASRPQREDSAWMESRRRSFGELDAALLAILSPERRVEAKMFGGIIDMTGNKFWPLGPAGEARK
jgi:hypothetical protein